MRVAALLLFLASAPAIADTPCLKIGIVSTKTIGDFQANATQKIFDRAQICVTLIRAPQNRINLMEEQGELDGDALRAQAYVENFPNLVAVPSYYVTVHAALYWRADVAEPAEPGRRVGAVLGGYWTKQIVRELGLQLYEVGDYTQLFTMLKNGRLSQVILSREAYAGAVDHTIFEPDSFASRDVRQIPMHLTLNQRYAALVPTLDSAIKSLVADGTLTQPK
jgi:hypothetical protein